MVALDEDRALEEAPGAPRLALPCPPPSDAVVLLMNQSDFRVPHLPPGTTCHPWVRQPHHGLQTGQRGLTAPSDPEQRSQPRAGQAAPRPLPSPRAAPSRSPPAAFAPRPWDLALASRCQAFPPQPHQLGGPSVGGRGLHLQPLLRDLCPPGPLAPCPALPALWGAPPLPASSPAAAASFSSHPPWLWNSWWNRLPRPALQPGVQKRPPRSAAEGHVARGGRGSV